MSQALEEIGKMLEATREDKGLDIANLAEKLKIRQRYLLAIERGELDELPDSAYIIGYLRSYANALGLDGDAVVNHFKEGTESVEKETAFLPEPHKPSMRPLPVVLAISLVATSALYVYWYHGSNELHSKVTEAVASFRSKQQNPLPVNADNKGTVMLPASLDNAAADQQAVVLGAVPISDVAGSAEPGAKIILVARGTSWLQIVTKANDFLLEKKLRPGESYIIPSRDDLMIRTRNPELIDVYVQGATQKALLGTLAKFSKKPLSDLNPASGGVPQE